MSAKPSIFTFATRELSQDAFICWLVAWARCDENPAMRDCAREFVTLLYNLGGDLGPVSAGEVTDVSEPRRQMHHIDVYFQATVRGRRVSFIIEDKTHTSHHSHQLERYREAVAEDNTHEDETVAIYFKTGFLYAEDRAVEEQGYSILDWQKLQEFLDAHNPGEALYDDFREFANEAYFRPYTDYFPRLMKEGDTNLLSHAHVQWQYVEALRARIATLPSPTIGIDPRGLVERGANVGGAPWTQLPFVMLPRVYGEITEYVSYRVDRRTRGFYLAVRQYADVKDEKHKELKRARLALYRKLFEAARSRLPGPVPAFADPRGDHSGHKESDIAILYFDEAGN